MDVNMGLSSFYEARDYLLMLNDLNRDLLVLFCKCIKVPLAVYLSSVFNMHGCNAQ